MAGIPMPPWLGPAAAQGWGDLAARGAQLQLERARIQQSGINANIEANARREAQQAESNRQQQQIQYSKAYHDAELGLRQQAIDNQEQKLQQQVKSVATKSAAMMRISSRIAAGEDPSLVYMQEGPAAGMTADALMRAGEAGKNAAFVPSTVTKDGVTFAKVSPGRFTVVKPPTDTETIRQVPNPNYTPGGKEPQFLSLTNRTTRLPAGASAGAAPADTARKQPTQKDIDHLKDNFESNPGLKAKFDKEFGAGAADEALNLPVTGQDIP